MNGVFRDLFDKCVIIYPDDILIYSKTREQHLQALEAIFQRLQQHRLITKGSKCEFLKQELEFLGHVISTEGIRIDPKKLRAIQEWKPPANQQQLQSFLGFVNYVRRFIPHMAGLTGPLTDLLQKGTFYEWGEKQQAAFEALKTLLMSPPVLCIADPERPFEVITDASDIAIGAVLMQDFGNGLQPIAYESRKMQSAERNYPVHDKEILAIVHAFKIWRCYVTGADVTVRTDHKSLQYLRAQPNLNPRQIRWLDYLESNFTYKITYKKGGNNIADALSKPSAQIAAALQRFYYWPDMVTDVQRYVAACPICQRMKSSHQRPTGLLQPLEPPQRPWQHVTMDFVTGLPAGPSGNNAVLVVVDRLTKMAHFAPCRTTITAEETARLFISTVVRLHGIPAAIISDRDPKFTSKFWQDTWARYGTRLQFSSAYHPQTDGQTERTNQTMEQLIRTNCLDRNKWEEALPMLEFSYNNAPSATTNHSPFYLNYGMDPTVPISTNIESVYYLRSGTDRIWVPRYRLLRELLIQEVHDSNLSGHFGVDKTLKALQRFYYWPDMVTDVQRYVAACPICQRMKSSHQRLTGLLQPLEPPQRPWQHVTMDFVTGLPAGPSGNNAVLVVVDRLTKMTHLALCRTTITTEETARLFISTVVRLHGIPAAIISDRDPKFTSKFWQDTWAQYGTHLQFSSAYHPQTDGQTERTNQTMEQLIRTNCLDRNKWEDVLPMLEFSYNNAPSATTNHSPFYLNYGMDPTVPISTNVESQVPRSQQFVEDLQTARDKAVEHIRKANATARRYADLHRRDITMARQGGGVVEGRVVGVVAVVEVGAGTVVQTRRPGLELQQFLGFANYYNRFVPQYAKLAAPLTNLLKKNTPYKWEPKHQEAVEQLKQALTSAPVLILPDSERDYVIKADASDQAVGAVLMQDQGNGLQPIAYLSKKLHGAELNYPIHDKEALAIVIAFKAWRCYLKGRRTTVYTDHCSLKYLKTQPNLSRRQVRWIDFLETHFHYDIVYKPGHKNKADALSRPAHWDSDIAYRKGSTKIWVPNYPPLRQLLLKEYHDVLYAGHFGSNKTLTGIAKHYYWPHMADDVQKFVTSCDTCQRMKSSKQKKAGLLQPLPVPEQPWQVVSLDFITGLPPTTSGHDAILVVIDKFSKMGHFIPTHTTARTEETAQLFVRHIISQHGIPTTLIADRDPKFTSKFWKELMSLLGTKLAMSSAYHPQTDGQTERLNQIVEQLLRAACKDEISKWDLHLPVLEFAYNNATHAATGQTPFFLCYERHPLTPQKPTISATETLRPPTPLRCPLCSSPLPSLLLSAALSAPLRFPLCSSPLPTLLLSAALSAPLRCPLCSSPLPTLLLSAALSAPLRYPLCSSPLPSLLL
ncbi:hypothetical protein CLOP_g14407 [Closterium sp. NIES-67]|nr:hypothetical protein CLOP_g14407 [Closterium sp. NIES-67]